MPARTPKSRHEKPWMIIFNAGILFVLSFSGIWYYGSIFVFAAQLFLLACVLGEQDEYVPLAANISTVMAIANMLTAIVIWKHQENIMLLISAAVRAGVVSVVSVCTVVVSQNLAKRVLS